MTNEQHQSFYMLESILLNGLVKCRTKSEISGLIEQIYKATYVVGNVAGHNMERLEKIINNETKLLKNDT